MAYTTHDITRLQKTLAPAVYEALDLDRAPERFRSTLGPNSSLHKQPRFGRLLADDARVELFRQLTLMGDPLADAFAATIPSIGFPRARQLVDRAAEHGIDAVPDAPPELVRWIRAMEEVPAWVDWDRIDRAAKGQRLLMALAGEALVRAGFMVTYVNGYQGLPMVITGALTTDAAAKRMKETISTFKWMLLPNALRRGGPAYQSAVKVRLMHAMVRTTLLRRKEAWDFDVYGTPIPQVDQMGAALLTSFRLAQVALKRGGHFTPAMRDLIELQRYTASLLGMHDQFLSDDPRTIVETWETCQATLKHKHDPRGKDLNRATIEAYRRRGTSAYDRALHALDVRATRVMYTGLVGRRTAVEMGVDAGVLDGLALAAGGLPLGAAFTGLSLLQRVPALDGWIDERAIGAIQQQLADDGPAVYRTDERAYKGLRPAPTDVARSA